MIKNALFVLVFFVSSVNAFVNDNITIRQQEAYLNSNSAANVLEQVLPATVFIYIEVEYFQDSFCPDIFRPVYDFLWPPDYFLGSGFIISPEGYIFTNAHVVKGANSVVVAFQGQKKRFSFASIVGIDEGSDIAILKVNDTDLTPLPFLKFADFLKTKVGESVFAIGNPLGYERSASLGIISSKERYLLNNRNFFQNYIQMDASVTFGNSGGAIVNLKGEVVGSVNRSPIFQNGISFAIPSYIAKAVSEQLIANGKVSQGFLGVVPDLEEEQERPFRNDYFILNNKQGMHVKSIIQGSPAEKADLKEGDIITSINGYPICSFAAFNNHIAILEPDTTVSLTVKRADKEISILVKLGTK